LQDFEDNIFQTSHCPELMAEDDRWEMLDRDTKEWWEKMGHGQDSSQTVEEY
jgi:hypothetical protein